MIILPTEKRFNWNNPPFILCLLIFLNVCIYFFYQSGDDAKTDKSIELYLDAGLLEKEWEPYLAFLKESGKAEEIKELQHAFSDGYKDYVAYAILADKKFTANVGSRTMELYGEYKQEGMWQKRERAAAIFNSTSALSFGLIPNDIGVVNLFAYQFLHGDEMHLFGNLFFLVVCGFAVEAAIGHWLFLLFYLLSGLAGGLAFAATDFNGSQPLIGASGAISGVMAMYLWVFRLKKIEFFYWFYMLVGYIRLPALMILPLYIGIEIFQFFINQDSNVAFMAHAGGFVSASLMMGILLWWKPETMNEDYIEEDQTINPYQQKLAEVFRAMETGQFPLASKRLQEMTTEYGNRFELDLLQYQLMKTHPSEQLNNTVKKVLSHTKLNTAELRRQEKVWNENTDLQKNLSEDELLKIGMRFSALDGLASAEQIFSRLNEKNSNNQMMGVFARKLAVSFEKLRHKEKASYYSRLADAFLQGVKP